MEGIQLHINGQEKPNSHNHAFVNVFYVNLPNQNVNTTHNKHKYFPLARKQVRSEKQINLLKILWNFYEEGHST
jgi:hypothetical protein